MRIGQVAKLSGLTPRTIDYYTQQNLLRVERSSSNYRLYHEDVLITLEKIKRLKQQRYSIPEIQTLIYLQENQGVDMILNEVQDEVNRLNGKLDLLSCRLRELPKVERERVFRTLEEELLNVIKRLTQL